MLVKYLRFVAFFAGSFLLLTVLGCGAGNDYVPVAGQVLVNDKPLEKGSIAFHPDESKGNAYPHAGRGSINNGSYSITSDSGNPGLPPGWYKVAVRSDIPADPKDEYSPPKRMFDAKYQEHQKSGIQIEVVDNPAAEAYDINIK